MTKELEALERIETTFSMNKQGKESVYRYYTNSIYPYYEDFDLVLNALKRLEAIDNANPSEALEKVNKVLDSCYEYEKKTGKNAIVHISKEPLIEIQQALMRFNSICTLQTDNSIIHFDIDDNNERLVCMYEKHYFKIAIKKLAWNLIKSKAMFYDNNTKCKIEIEADDFNSSEEWEQVKEVLENDNSR